MISRKSFQLPIHHHIATGHSERDTDRILASILELISTKIFSSEAHKQAIDISGPRPTTSVKSTLPPEEARGSLAGERNSSLIVRSPVYLVSRRRA